jgi:hypothetical protein
VIRLKVHHAPGQIEHQRRGQRGQLRGREQAGLATWRHRAELEREDRLGDARQARDRELGVDQVGAHALATPDPHDVTARAQAGLVRDRRQQHVVVGARVDQQPGLERADVDRRHQRARA